MSNFFTPFFSVIVPIYNKGPYINRAISSILNQTFNDFELILVCDPSTDNSLEEVKKFKDERISVYHRSTPGPGGYAARNLGVEKSIGKWIVFLDADDMYFKNNLENFFLLTKKYIDAKVLCCSKIIEEKGFKTIDTFSLMQKNNDSVFCFYDYLVYSFNYDKPFNTNSIAISRQLLDENSKLFPEDRAMRSGDIYVWVKLVAEAREFVWSKNVGSHTFKDVVGVSKTNAPSMSLNIDMVNEISPKCRDLEVVWLKRYANKLIRTSYFEQKRLLNKAEASLFKTFYWRKNIFYCFFWSMLSLMPYRLLFFIKKLRRRG